MSIKGRHTRLASRPEGGKQSAQVPVNAEHRIVARWYGHKDKDSYPLN